MSCDKCNQNKFTQIISVGNNKTENWCSECIAEDVRKRMRKNKSELLYIFCVNDGVTPTHVIDFACCLRIPITYFKVSDHNFAGKNGRTDVWFNFEGRVWHGVHVGFMNTYVSCRETKRVST